MCRCCCSCSFGISRVLKTLPPPRQSLALPGGTFLNLRGLYLPAPAAQRPGFSAVLLALAAGIVASIGSRFWARRRQQLTGAQFPSGLAALGLIVGAAALVFAFRRARRWISPIPS